MSHKPSFKTVTVRCKSKKRITVTLDQSLLELVQAVGQKIGGDARMESEEAGELKAIYALQTNNIVEIYMRPGQELVGYMFANIDAWISHPNAVDAE